MLLTERFSAALVFAAELHASQHRKRSGVPYVSHLLGVAAIVLEHGGTEDEAIAALLHDAIEDQGGPATRDEIRRRFGDRVAAIVDGCTDAETIPKPPWRARKEQHLVRLRDADASIRLVCAADKLHNARALLADYRALGEELWQHFNGGREGTLWYYAEASAVLGGAQHATLAHYAALLDELARTVDELHRLARVVGK